ncbi:protein ripply1 [Pezoporus flaviventris]|uniref:protein ripply1 n=1 Tax=Pezoporus flaviventris TaxID=889875 RepID=UPI002AAFBE6A|nr:protein ripply1 [Pezoporus flaviventris]
MSTGQGDYAGQKPVGGGGGLWREGSCCQRGPHAPRGRSPRAGPTTTVSPQARPREAAADGGPDKALAFFHHPVRLLWPRSKSFDYLYAVGEKLLQNFPVQATLCLYEDSGSEEDEEEEDEEEEEEEEEEAGAMPAGSPPHAGSAARPA